MAARTLRGEEKIAAVLMGLPPAATESVLARLGSPHSERLRAELDRLSTSPPPAESIEQVLHELDESLRRSGAKAIDWQPRIAPGTSREFARVESPPWNKQTGSGPMSSSSSGGPTPERSETDTTAMDSETNDQSDPIDELRAIDADRLASALDGEHASTAALVLNCLDSDKAGEVLKRLPAEPRRDAFIWLRHGATGSKELLPRIVRAIVRKSRSGGENGGDASGDAKCKKMAEMLRLLERGDRMEVLAALEQQDSDTATRVKELLYQFEDLLLIEDRSMQKLLAEIDSKTLALALKEASSEICEKVMRNMSKRARESLTEEIGFLGLVPAAELKRTQKAVVDVIQRLDQAGELVIKQ